jgi:hypothetical protein
MNVQDIRKIYFINNDPGGIAFGFHRTGLMIE